MVVIHFRYTFSLALIGLSFASATTSAQSLGQPQPVDNANTSIRTIPKATSTRTTLDPASDAEPSTRSIPSNLPRSTETDISSTAEPARPWWNFGSFWSRPESSAPPARESLWTKTKRSLGFNTDDPTSPAFTAQERAVDRETNQEFLAAEELFRKEDYVGSQKAFKSLSRKYKDKPLEEDILFMLAESQFKLDMLPKAEDTYHKLLMKFPNTRYMPQAVQRSYDIAYYWLEDSRLRAEGKPGKYGFSRYINFFDRTRPLFDAEGRAIETVEVIQQFDPFGPLTDDAVMMAAAQTFITDRYVQAAGYYQQLVADQPQSEHAPKAKILAEQAYLRSYRGPQYDSSDLNGAEQMGKAALDTAEQYGDDQRRRLEADLRAIHIERAKRDFITAEDFRKRWLYTSAKFYYGEVVKRYPDTDWARLANEKLEEFKDMETQRFSFTEFVKNPMGGGWTTARPGSRMFSNSTGQDQLPGAEAPQRTEDSSRPAGDTPAPAKNKSNWGMRNWLDQL
jgi:outer membrane protein assembly factor BamD (BamD/ComL family)